MLLCIPGEKTTGNEERYLGGYQSILLSGTNGRFDP